MRLKRQIAHKEVLVALVGDPRAIVNHAIEVALQERGVHCFRAVLGRLGSRTPPRLLVLLSLAVGSCVVVVGAVRVRSPGADNQAVTYDLRTCDFLLVS